MSANTVLKTLTDTAFDSVEGYRKAAEKAESPQLKQALQQRAQQREQTVQQMNAEIARQGGELVTKGTMTGEAHQMWMSITDAFENGDEAAAERVEEGEDYLKGKFESALEDDDLDPQSRSVVQQCYAEISEGEQFGDMISKQYD
ncbi:ferritin-like domain-containing protein [Aurantiacibacter aquimixticola]|uniref:PA2169 family four-helix-bundle protein n=1 Tax=Aurantiacibacter aquimixticola TaxID=1958945 RepID=A0A419RRE3_9SPHN|nr:PA2169 family four-helix-bundle protein [Aurantiacibacter aquimixticola]RJY08372.1 PA2169 family four-helix-bundle protein [Aurantiacibacter aquimixticola]